MPDKLTTIDMPKPPKLAAPPPDIARQGLPFQPIDRIRAYSSGEWEAFTVEWATSLEACYERIEQCGGAGDKGRDVIGWIDETAGEWDNYQCKHYKNPLTPTNIWVELGKLFYYVERGDYSMPSKYRFVAPQGAGTSLCDLFRNQEALRDGLMSNWDKWVKEKIIKKQAIGLSGGLKSLIEAADFSVFSYESPYELIKGHRSTPYYTNRFGGMPPRKPLPKAAPKTITQEELTYVQHLLDAYDSHSQHAIQAVDDLQPDPVLTEHFEDSRRDFYCAESLRTFSRDNLPPESYQQLKDQYYDGLKQVARDLHPDGYERVKAVVEKARALQITDHALVERMHTNDRSGICFQLSNDDRLKWV
ncbi:hypothetical protein MalM25_08330 [Planctomycetes bacterium MalM25]|nr:hypothetical protein MalM25_08330 [Planctomycetes bacterium MalM25]